MKTIEEMRAELLEICAAIVWEDCVRSECPLARWCRNMDLGVPNTMTSEQIEQTYTEWKQEATK